MLLHLDQLQSPLTPLVMNVGNFTFLAEEPQALYTHQHYDSLHARNSGIQEYANICKYTIHARRTRLQCTTDIAGTVYINRKDGNMGEFKNRQQR